ncbi:MAG: sialidase family protein, partial [Thermodesulfobacteriota bacterium]
EQSLVYPTKRVSPSASVIGDDGRIYVSWMEEDKDLPSLYFASSSDKGKTFTKKVKVNSWDDLPSGIYDGPAMAIGKNKEIYIAWTGWNMDEFRDIRFSRSLDHGKTFSRSIKINDNKKLAPTGFESIAVSKDGTILAAWIDSREGEPTLYTAISEDKGASFKKNVRVDKDVCPCCRTSIAFSPGGAAFVIWRKVFEGNIREMVVSSSNDNGKTFSPPRVMGNDKWRFEGCPHRSGSIAIGEGGRIYAAWYAEGEGVPMVYIGTSDDKGETFSKTPVPVKSGFFPDHPSLAISGNKVILVWEEATPVTAKIMMARFDEAAKTFVEKTQVNESARKSRYPLIRSNSKGDVLVSWLKEDMKNSRTVLRLGR